MDTATHTEDSQSSKRVLTALFKIFLFSKMRFVGSSIHWLRN